MGVDGSTVGKAKQNRPRERPRFDLNQKERQSAPPEEPRSYQTKCYERPGDPTLRPSSRKLEPRQAQSTQVAVHPNGHFLFVPLLSLSRCRMTGFLELVWERPSPLGRVPLSCRRRYNKTKFPFPWTPKKQFVFWKDQRSLPCSATVQTRQPSILSNFDPDHIAHSLPQGRDIYNTIVINQINDLATIIRSTNTRRSSR